MTADPLKPCPFCGAAAILDELKTLNKYNAHCSQDNQDGFCPVQPELQSYTTKEQAIEQWNTRALPPAIRLQPLPYEGMCEADTVLGGSTDPAASGWRTIETANKDEQIIGAIWTGTVFGFPFEAEYNEENNKWESLRITEILPHNPTHWFDFSLMKAPAAMREVDLDALKGAVRGFRYPNGHSGVASSAYMAQHRSDEQLIDHLHKRGLLRVGEG